MALPKRKHSKARRDKSRTHWKLAIASTTKCAQCAKPIRPHHACIYCGYYRGRQVIQVRVKKKDESSSR